MDMELLSRFQFSDIVSLYMLDKERQSVGLVVSPDKMESSIHKDKEYANDSLIQIKILGDDYPFGFSQGRTMRNAQSTMELKFDTQYVIDEVQSKTVVTVLKNARNHILEHRLKWYEGHNAVEISSAFKNNNAGVIFSDGIESDYLQFIQELKQ